MNFRTGNVDELVLSQDADGKTVVQVAPLVDGEGNVVSISMGDGSNGKPLKCEWTTQKGGKLVVGSTGKERTDDDGNIVHEGEMWCKTLEPGPSWSVTHVDTRSAYGGLRAAALCPQGAGYMIHEAGRWSAVHGMWLFAPRKLSRKPYDEVIGLLPMLTPHPGCLCLARARPWRHRSSRVRTRWGGRVHGGGCC